MRHRIIKWGEGLLISRALAYPSANIYYVFLVHLLESAHPFKQEALRIDRGNHIVQSVPIYSIKQIASESLRKQGPV